LSAYRTTVGASGRVAQSSSLLYGLDVSSRMPTRSEMSTTNPAGSPLRRSNGGHAEEPRRRRYESSRDEETGIRP